MSEIRLTYAQIKKDVADLYKTGMRRVRQGELQSALWFHGRIETYYRQIYTKDLGDQGLLCVRVARLSVKLHNALVDAKAEGKQNEQD